jgi:hypothetical protein
MHNSLQIEMSSGWIEHVRESRAVRITELAAANCKGGSA